VTIVDAPDGMGIDDLVVQCSRFRVGLDHGDAASSVVGGGFGSTDRLSTQFSSSLTSDI
jgi:hypothetical protein